MAVFALHLPRETETTTSLFPGELLNRIVYFLQSVATHVSKSAFDEHLPMRKKDGRRRRDERVRFRTGGCGGFNVDDYRFSSHLDTTEARWSLTREVFVLIRCVRARSVGFQTFCLEGRACLLDEIQSGGLNIS